MQIPFSPAAAHWRTRESHKRLIGIAKSLVLNWDNRAVFLSECSAALWGTSELSHQIESHLIVKVCLFFFFVKLNVWVRSVEVAWKPWLPLQVPEYFNKAFVSQRITVRPMPGVLCGRYSKNRLWEQVGTSCCQRRGAARSGEILQDAAQTPTYGVSRLQMM